MAADPDSDDNSDHDTDYGSLPALEILNRYCLKVKEEAMVSAKTMSSIKQVTISLMKATTAQCERQVHRVLHRYGIDPASRPELDDAFESGLWDHDSPDLNINVSMRNYHPEVQPRQILLGKDVSGRDYLTKRVELLNIQNDCTMFHYWLHFNFS